MANLVLKTNTVGNDVSVEMLRGDSYCDWRIVNTGGNLCMQATWTTAKVDYYNVLKLEYNTGAITAKGRITAPGITSSGQVFITSTNETALTANTGALLIGTASGTHLSLIRSNDSSSATEKQIMKQSVSEYESGLISSRSADPDSSHIFIWIVFPFTETWEV